MVDKCVIKQDLLSYIQEVCNIKSSETNTIVSEIFEDSRIRAAELAFIVYKLMIKYEVNISNINEIPSVISIDSLVDYIFDKIH